MCKLANTFLMMVGSLVREWVSGNSLKTLVALFLVVSPFALFLVVVSSFHFKVHHFRLAALISFSKCFPFWWSSYQLGEED